MKTITKYLTLIICLVGLCASSVAFATPCEVKSNSQDASSMQTLRYIVEDVLNKYSTVCTSDGSEASDYEQAVEVVNNRTITMDSKLSFKVKEASSDSRDAVIVGNADRSAGYLVIDGLSLSDDSPIVCDSNFTGKVALRNVVVLTNTTDQATLFSSTSCFTNPDGTAYVCNEAHYVSGQNPYDNFDTWCPTDDGDDNPDDNTWVVYYEDADGDNYGNPDQWEMTNNGAPEDYVTDNTDCDDTDAGINPGAWDICYDDIDQDCSGTARECGSYPFMFVTKYQDSDGDGYGDPATEKQCLRGLGARSAASGPFSCDGYVTDNTDCDDTVAAVNPGATEICDGIDNDCNGDIDDGLNCNATTITYYEDKDGDGYGDSGDSGTEFESDPGTGYTKDHTDCDDGVTAVNPGATEICDDIDNDCDGSIDENDVCNDDDEDDDKDDDGYPEDVDCDDTNPDINPGMDEICDNDIDDNCDGLVDDPDTCEVDLDGDGYTASGGDCDDTNAAINPGMDEICDNDIDDNCDGSVDDTTTCQTPEITPESDSVSGRITGSEVLGCQLHPDATGPDSQALWFVLSGGMLMGFLLLRRRHRFFSTQPNVKNLLQPF